MDHREKIFFWRKPSWNSLLYYMMDFQLKCEAKAEIRVTLTKQNYTLKQWKQRKRLTVLLTRIWFNLYYKYIIININVKCAVCRHLASSGTDLAESKYNSYTIVFLLIIVCCECVFTVVLTVYIYIESGCSSMGATMLDCHVSTVAQSGHWGQNLFLDSIQ